jgi:hypothetical protein
MAGLSTTKRTNFSFSCPREWSSGTGELKGLAETHLTRLTDHPPSNWATHNGTCSWPNAAMNYVDEVLLFAQTDPAWECWDTSTYLTMATAASLIAIVGGWLVVRSWRNGKAQDHRRTK